MVYSICLKWGGIHGDVTLRDSDEELLYVTKNALFRWWRKRTVVVDAQANEVFHIHKGPELLGSAYLIQSAGNNVGKVGSNWCWTRGHIELAGLPPICCKYGCGLKTTLTFMAGTQNIASITLQSGWGVRSTLLVDDPVFNEPRFLVGCVLIFLDWTSRG